MIALSLYNRMAHPDDLDLYTKKMSVHTRSRSLIKKIAVADGPLCNRPANTGNVDHLQKENL